MITSSHGGVFRITDSLWGESTGHRWIPLTKASDAELWCFHWCMNRLLEKQSSGWWFVIATVMWRHCNVREMLKFSFNFNEVLSPWIQLTLTPFQEYENVFSFSIISRHWNVTVIWHPSLGLTGAHLSCVIKPESLVNFFFFFKLKRHQPREQASLNPVWCEVTYWWLTDNCSPHHRPLNFENSVLLF